MQVLERLQAMKLSKQPGVIALTALGRDDFISRAVNPRRELLHGQAV